MPTLGSLLGQKQVWIGLVLLSDSSNTVPEGAYVDDVVLRKYVDTAKTQQAPAPLGGGVGPTGLSEPAMRSCPGD